MNIRRSAGFIALLSGMAALAQAMTTRPHAWAVAWLLIAIGAYLLKKPRQEDYSLGRGHFERSSASELHTGSDTHNSSLWAAGGSSDWSSNPHSSCSSISGETGSYDTGSYDTGCSNSDSSGD